MKTTKKILALAAALITLMFAMSLQSFALFGKELPTIESIKFTDTYPISEKDLVKHYSYLDEIAEDLGEDIASIIEKFDIPYDLGNSNIPYEVEIILSDGNKTTLALDDFSCDFEDYSVYVEASVDYDEFINITENNAKTAVVEFCVGVYDTKNTVKSEFASEKNVKSCIVAAMLPLGSLPTDVNSNCDYYDIADTKFLVTYADLKTETITLKATTDEYGNYEYFLGDMELNVYTDEEEQSFNIEYLDDCYTKSVTINPEPFKEIKITECDFDAEKGVLNSIKYAITLNDGTVQNFENSFTKPVVFDDYIKIGMLENYFIYLYVSDYEYSESGMLLTDEFCITVEVGYDDCCTDTFRVENPRGFFLKIKMWFISIIDFIKMILGIM